MAVNSWADISSLVDNIHEDALVVAREFTLATRLVQVFADRDGMAPRDVTQYGQVTINSLGEDDDMVGQAFNRTTLSTLTPARYGAQIFALDTRIASDPESYRSDSAQELGGAMAAKIDTDILGNFDSLTGGTIGASGTTLSWTHFFAAQTILRGNSVPPPYFCVLHPYQWYDLASEVLPGATVTNAPMFQDDIARRFFVQNVGGVDIFISANCEESGTDAYGAMFSRSAIAYDQRKGFTLEPERDASREGWELNASSWYAHGTWRPSYGVQILSDITTPTG